MTWGFCDSEMERYGRTVTWWKEMSQSDQLYHVIDRLVRVVKGTNDCKCADLP